MAPNPGPPVDPESCRDGRDLENGRDLEAQPLVHHLSYDPNSRWQKLKMALVEPPKSTVSIYADISFNHAEWKRHRNAAWRHRPQPILFMRVAGGFWHQLTYTFLVSIIVGLYHHHFQDINSAASRLAVPFNLTTFALSLLLVFRTNSSYSRWWEARQVWGAVVNLSRNFARQSLLWLPPDKARVAVRWMMAAPFLLKCHLRFNASVRENVSHVLLPKELDWVLGWTHRPNAAAHVLSTAVIESRLDTIREKLMMELVDTYIDCVGKCERIFKTPIPAAYTRHTSRYLMIYLTACPLVLWPSLGWWTLIASVLITFLLLGTENIGVQLEEPFRVLPLDDMCRGIEATLREMERHNVRMPEQFNSWLEDPAGLTRVSSESSLDSFQDGPADGPSEPSALNRFHHIPPPALISAAAQALLPQGLLQRRLSTVSSFNMVGSSAAVTGVTSPSAAVTGSGSGDLSHHLATSQAGSGGGRVAGLVPHLYHHVQHPLVGTVSNNSSNHTGVGGGRSGNGMEAGGPIDLDLEHGRRSSGGGGGAVQPHSHYPHHVHHQHRRLPQHPADVPSAALAAGAGAATPGAAPGLSSFGSNRWNRLSFGRVAGLETESPPRQPAAAAAQPAATAATQPGGGEVSQGSGSRQVSSSPFARESLQQQQEQVQRQDLGELRPGGGSLTKQLDSRSASGGGRDGAMGNDGSAAAAAAADTGGSGADAAEPSTGEVVSQRAPLLPK